MMRTRAGHTLLELLVALPLAGLLLALVLIGIVAQTRLARVTGERAARMEAERTTGAVLGAELRWAAPPDVRTDGPDSIRMRVFRGVGLPCGDAVRWYGIRDPAPAKDSALVVNDRGEFAARVASAAPAAACEGHRLTLDGTPADGVLLVFETGTYYLQDRALRYRTGGEGRQPLTEEWFSDGATRFLAAAGGVPRGALLAFRPTGEQRHSSWLAPNDPPW